MMEKGSLEVARREIVDKLMKVPGVGRSRAEAIYDSGYTNMGMLRKASMEELTGIPGVSISLARCIINNISSVPDDTPADITVGPPGGEKETPKPATDLLIVTSVAAGNLGTTAVGKSPKPSEVPNAAPHPEEQKGAPSKGFISSFFGKLFGKPEEKKAEKKPDELKPEEKKDEKKDEKKEEKTTDRKDFPPPEKKDETKDDKKDEELKVSGLEPKKEDEKDGPLKVGGVPAKQDDVYSKVDPKPEPKKDNQIAEDIAGNLKKMGDKTPDLNKTEEGKPSEKK